MSTWTLILFFHVGMMGADNANATTTVSGFSTQNVCETAGKRAKRLATGTKEMNFVCVEVK